MNPNKSNRKSETTINENTHQGRADTAEVLYQRLGNKWYAFSLIGNDVFVGAVDTDALDAAELSAKAKTRSGNA